MYLRKPKTVAVIYGAFTLGLYVAIQGPTMMDLIDLLHVNQDIMSYSLAFASLGYALGGLLSGFLFNYVNRQTLTSAFFLIFGAANIATPYITNYNLFFCVTVFKMLCAGGTDCAANVWILEMWPGKDSLLQALHFSFAVGCALGPLIVEPFLGVESKDNGQLEHLGKSVVTLSDQGTESRIHIPYAVSGLTSVSAAIYIIYLYYIEERHKRLVASASAPILIQDQAVSPVPLQNTAATPQQTDPKPRQQTPSPPVNAPATAPASPTATVPTPDPEPAPAPLAANASPTTTPSTVERPQPQQAQVQQQHFANNLALQVLHQQLISSPMSTSIEMSPFLSNQTNSNSLPAKVKITSKVRDDLAGRPPYYVMLAVALSALCLSFYCGIEITSMNYLASFATNIDLQLSKSTAAYMSSALTISFAVGRGFGIWIAACTKPHHLFYLCGAIMASGNILMLIFANTAETLLWCSICWFGVGCGPMFPAIVSFYDDKISKVTNTVSGIFIMGSMFNVALNTLIIGHQIIENALILIVCNLIGSVLLMMLFGTLHLMTKIKKKQREKKFALRQRQLIALQQQGGGIQGLQLQAQTQQLLAPVPENSAQEADDGDSRRDSLNKTPSTPDSAAHAATKPTTGPMPNGTGENNASPNGDQRLGTKQVSSRGGGGGGGDDRDGGGGGPEKKAQQGAPNKDALDDKHEQQDDEHNDNVIISDSQEKTAFLQARSPASQSHQLAVADQVNA